MQHSRFWALEMLDAELPFSEFAYGVLGASSPTLMYRISKRETRILIDIPDKMRQTLGDLQAVRTHIKERVALAFPKSVQLCLEEALKSGRLRSMSACWLSSAVNHASGLIVLGDALNMRHPLTGGGMTVGLKDVALLTDMLRSTSLEDTDAVLDLMKKFHW